MLAALLLSGCFRPAGDTMQPTQNSTSESPNQALDNATATTGAPPITLLSPNTPEGETPQAGPALTQVTVIPFEPTTTPTPISGTLTPTLQIITPGISLDLVTPATPLPTEELLPPDNSAVGIETPATLAAPSESETLVSGAPCTYTVQPGDSLYRIAILNNTTVAKMMDANPELTGDPPILQPRQVLRLPDCSTDGQSGDTSVSTVPADEGAASNAPAPGTEIYTVKPGDTLYGIATHYGTTVTAIMQANNLSNPNTLSIGQQLIIPSKN